MNLKAIMSALLLAASMASGAESFTAPVADLKVYVEPTFSSEVLAVLSKGQQVLVVEDTVSGFKKVLVTDGGVKKIGYMHGKDLPNTLTGSVAQQTSTKAEAALLPTAPVAFMLKDAVGDEKFCKVFTTGNGSCDYDTLEACKSALRGSDEACLNNKVGATVAKSQYDPTLPVKAVQKQVHDPCVDGKDSGLKIVKRLTAHSYEVVYYNPYDQRGYAVHRNGASLEKWSYILITKKATFSTIGRPFGIKITPTTETKDVELENGFTIKAAVLRECGVTKVPKNPFIGSGFAYRDPIAGD